MKTTLNIDDAVMRQLKVEAAKRGRTMSDLVESALRQFLEPTTVTRELPPLPSYHCGGILVDVDDRDALYDVLDQDSDKHT